MAGQLTANLHLYDGDEITPDVLTRPDGGRFGVVHLGPDVVVYPSNSEISGRIAAAFTDLANLQLQIEQGGQS
jgi:hypothetical protein